MSLRGQAATLLDEQIQSIYIIAEISKAIVQSGFSLGPKALVAGLRWGVARMGN